jgi:hypothetical protein
MKFIIPDVTILEISTGSEYSHKVITTKTKAVLQIRDDGEFVLGKTDSDEIFKTGAIVYSISQAQLDCSSCPITVTRVSKNIIFCSRMENLLLAPKLSFLAPTKSRLLNFMGMGRIWKISCTSRRGSDVGRMFFGALGGGLSRVTPSPKRLQLRKHKSSNARNRTRNSPRHALRRPINNRRLKAGRKSTEPSPQIWPSPSPRGNRVNGSQKRAVWILWKLD